MSRGKDMKRIGLILFALVLATFALSGCKAQEQYVKLDQKNFPDWSLYSALKV